MQTTTFNNLRALIYEVSGISLAENKMAMVKARIAKHMRKLGTVDHEEYLQRVLDDESQRELGILIDLVSTNVTDFYREARHFEILRESVQKTFNEGSDRLRLWSAACSSGEEPYTIAIEILEALNGLTGDIKILASDISSRMLRACMKGVYEEKRVEPVPGTLKHKYFHKIRQEGRTLYQVQDSIKKLVYVRRINLIEIPYALKGPMDAIFCRNVMIYFDQPTREKVVAEFSRLLRPGGILFLGHAETINQGSSGFTNIGPSTYRLGR